MITDEITQDDANTIKINDIYEKKPSIKPKKIIVCESITKDAVIYGILSSFCGGFIGAMIGKEINNLYSSFYGTFLGFLVGGAVGAIIFGTKAGLKAIINFDEKPTLENKNKLEILDIVETSNENLEYQTSTSNSRTRSSKL